jgi:hypothetical protein
MQQAAVVERFAEVRVQLYGVRVVADGFRIGVREAAQVAEVVIAD